jgi:uncharacterized protein (TIRG00374 family)
LKLLKFAFLALGLLLLGWILAGTDLDALWQRVLQVGWVGMVMVIALYFLTFLTDVVGWQITFESVPFGTRWALRLYAVRMVGEAFNNVTPTASLGGEPVKAYLLKAHYRIGYAESGASLVLAKTTNLFGLVLFLGAGFVLLFHRDAVAAPYQVVAGVGLAGLTLITCMFFLFQRLQVSSFAGTRVGRSRFGARLTRGIEFINSVDRQFHRFYAQHPLRFGCSVALAVMNWWMGIVEIYLVMGFLGYPVTLAEAWVIEALVQLVRAGTFFIPAAIGTQEAALMLASGAITGAPLSGIAFALVRRARELIWIGAGLALWWLYSHRAPVSPADRETAPLSGF